MLELLVEDDLLLEQSLLAVDLDAGEAVAAQLLEHVAELALPAAHDRRVDRELRSLGQREHLLDDLVERLARDRAAADRAVRAADPRIEEAEVVVDLRHGADRRARVARRRLLVDRDRGREAVDRVDIGLLHHLEELPRVRGERLDVTALPLGVDRVEGQARLARPGQAGHADERVPWKRDGDVLEVVLPRAVDDEMVSGHTGSSLAPERTFVQPLGLAGAAPEDEPTEGEAEAERADREGADRDALPPHRHLLPAADRLALLLGQLLAATLLAQRSAGLQAEVEVVEDLGAVRHVTSV